MDPLAIILGVLFLAASAAAVWLALQRVRLAAEAASAREAAARAEREAGEARAEAESERAEGEARAQLLRDQLTTRSDELSKLSAQSERLRAELAAALEAHEAAVDAARAQKDDAVAALRREHEERLAGERRAMAERDKAREEAFAKLERTLQENVADLRRSHERRIAEINAETSKAFEAAAAGVLRTASSEFLRQASENFRAQHQAGVQDLERRREAVDLLVKPIAESIAATKQKLEHIEKERAETFGKLSSELRQVAEAGGLLRAETARLVGALKRPELRGRYGEIQLQRVAEVAGMRRFCDFAPQESVRDAEGRLLRPDLVVSLPNDRRIAVDAKTNIDAYIGALEANDPERAEQLLCKFADDVKAQVVALAKKQYWSNYAESPEFVVMFIPGDQFIDAALQRRPELLEYAAQHQVILASPSTLIGLLRAVHVGWKEKRVADAALELMEQGKELHRRAARVWELLEKLGGSLGQSVKNYNELVGSVESRLTPSLRKFEDAGAASEKQLAALPEVTVSVRGVENKLFAAPAAGANGEA